MLSTGRSVCILPYRHLVRLFVELIVLCFSPSIFRHIHMFLLILHKELINVLKKLPDCALWLVGDGPFRPELESISNGLPVKFLGYQSGEAFCTRYTL